jgi:tellurium resistance protein TerD
MEENKMAISLQKGGNINLSKDFGAGGDGLKEITIGLGWDTNKYDGGQEFDLDASAFLLGTTEKVLNEKGFIFYGNPGSTDGSVTHTGDNKTGEGDGDDERIEINLGKVSDDVEKISFTVTIHDFAERSQNFGQVSNAYVRVLDKATGEELVKYELDEDFSVESAIVVAELYKKNGDWRFKAVGSGFAGGLAALATNFGLSIS